MIKQPALQQTAVDWLLSSLLINGLLRLTKDEHNLYKEIKKQAEEMEKEQIIDAYKREAAYMKHLGCTDEMIDKSSIRYYNETYKQII